MKIVVAIATVGRPQIVGQAILDLAKQTRAPDRIIVSAAGPADIDPQIFAGTPLKIEELYGRRGLTLQRNAILDALDHDDIVLFLDDDFIMAPDFLEHLEQAFAAHPSVAVVTGEVLADGIGNAGVTYMQARTILDRAVRAHPSPQSSFVDVNNGYGCNMAFRCAPIFEHHLRFDETLPLYGWLEDVDFSRRVAAHGRCVKASALRGVHLGTKGGRTNGLRLGYSQVANPVYLMGRKTMQRGHAIRMILRNLTANTVKMFWPEPWIDRRGRLRGNLVAFGDLLRGRIDPQRILHLETEPDARS